MQWKKWQWPMVIVGLPVIAALLTAFGMAVWPGDLVGTVAPALSRTVLYALGIIATGVCITALTVVHAWAGRFDADDYSNPADFPVIAARRWIVLVTVNVALCWTGAIVARPAVLAVIILLFTVSSTIFIITALHPHRSRPVAEEEAPEPTPAAPERRTSRKKHQLILQAIHTVVVEQEAYLDAHLTIQDVADRSGYSRSTLSSLFKAEYGGFFQYVNRLRVRHVAEYLDEHPSATLQEAVLESGFNSRQAYYAVKAKVEE